MTREHIVAEMNTVRGFVLHAVEGLDPAQLIKAPDGFRNNILWNLGHIASVQCALLYRPCRRAQPLPESYFNLFYDGTSPADWGELPDTDEVLGVLRSLGGTIINDLNAGALDGFATFELVPGLKLSNVEQALSFHNVHEGIHLGTIMAMKKLV